MKKNVLAFIQNKNIFHLLSMLYSVNDSYENIFSNIIYTNKLIWSTHSQSSLRKSANGNASMFWSLDIQQDECSVPNIQWPHGSFSE